MSSQDGQITLAERLGIVLALLRLPLAIIVKSLTSPWSRVYKHKSWMRTLSDAGFRCLTISFNARQLQWYVGPTLNRYQKWCKAKQLQPTVEEIGEGARLLWMGPKRTDKVLLYFHGGAYLVPLQEYSLPFLAHVQSQLSRRKIEVGVALLNYSLAPNASYPIQLRQAIAALNHLLSQAIRPQDIHVIGDSAGANLFLQLLSHTLHPIPDLPPAPVLSAPIAGAYLMSPWVTFAPIGPTTKLCDSSDMFDMRTLNSWGATVGAGVPSAQRTYAEPITAPPEWWKGAETFVSRVLVSSGSGECLHSSVSQWAEVFSQVHGGVKTIAQENGVHDDPLLDFLVAEVGSVTPIVVDWLSEGFTA